ncbi:phosphoribosylamine--glycine ligase [Candidatus Gracilibacteria bacterium]|nr:phosphoribosylamine--glycine ligase [Candidatus Gracilibacteria bacterium]
MKKVLVIGNGGREHALVDALARSPQNPEIYNFGSGINPGIKKLVKEIKIGNAKNSAEVVTFAQSIKPDLVVIGPEDPLSVGVVDELKKISVSCFGPTKKCAQLESSKSFTRNLLQKYNIDASPGFAVFDTLNEKAMKIFFDKFQGQIVVKADGLIGGKGVLVAGDHFTEFSEILEFSSRSIEKFGRVVLEEKLIGEEFSLISLVDGETVLDCPAIQDHKRAFVGDTGPNTGGMGCISDEYNSLPFLREEDLKEAHEITVQTMQAIEKEVGEKYVGVMYGGFIVTSRGVKLIEYNARFGDPEALNILPILESNFLDVCDKAISGNLKEIGRLEFKKVATVVKYLCPEGYPTSPVKDVPIKIAKDFKETENQKVLFASIAEENNELILKGSRAVGILGTGNSIEEANLNCEKMIQNFSGPLFYRKDIGTKELIQKRIDHLKKVIVS